MLGRSSRQARHESGGDNETHEPLLGPRDDTNANGDTTIFALEDEDDAEEGSHYGGYSDHPVDGHTGTSQLPNGRVHGIALKSTLQSREAGT